jgi:hypothetical protein
VDCKRGFIKKALSAVMSIYEAKSNERKGADFNRQWMKNS